MPDTDAAAEAATGAVEPRNGNSDGHTHESACLNCGTPLEGSYCHACGQKAHVHRTIAGWWHDFVHSVLHLDGKFWRTLPLLVLRPGQLTRRYAHGERAKHVSPLALFLFSVFLMFAVFSLAGTSVIGTPGDVDLGVAEELQSAEADVARLQRERDAAAAAGQPTQDIEQRLNDARQTVSVLRNLDRGVVIGNRSGPIDADLSDAPAALRFLDEAFRSAKKNPSLLFYKLQANAYKFSWALIPLSVPFVWLLFLHRRRYRVQFTGYDHFVFVTYSIAFMSLALIALVVLRIIGIDWDPLDKAILLVPLVHMFVQLRGAYGLSLFSAAWRTLVLMMFAGIALALFGLLLLALGLYG